MDESYILNTTDWDSYDIDNKFVINCYGVDDEGNSVGLKINNFKPEFYIKIYYPHDSNNTELIDNIESKFDQFLQNLEILTNKSLYCKLNDTESDIKEIEYELNHYDPLNLESNEDEDKICHCFKCSPINLLDYNDFDKEHYDKPYFHKKGKNIDVLESGIVERQDLYDGFKWDKKNNTSLYIYKFVKIVFNNIKSFHKLKSNLNNFIFHPILKRKIPNKFILFDEISLYSNEINIDLYESNLQPLLKFFHIKNIKPCGWISILSDKLKKINTKYFNCTKSYDVDCNDINYCDKIGFAKFKILSWDIEADSEHGDFPNPIKEYVKQASEIADYYLLKIKKKLPVNEINILNILRIMFNYNIDKIDTILLDDLQYINKIYFKDTFKEKCREKISDIYKQIFKICEKYKSNDAISTNDIFNTNNNEYNSDYDDLGFQADAIKTNRDKIVYKINRLLIKKFKHHVRGDRLTQIGAVFQTFGTTIPYNNFIITLGSCDSFADNCIIIDTHDKNITNIVSEAIKYDESFIKIISFYDSEIYDNNNNKELDSLECKVIITFKELIVQYNPDIIIAYNNFGFDNPFIMKRCEELNITEIFSKISKLYNHDAKLIEKDLSSAALGENILHLIDTKGRVHIDLMKLVQRDHKLDSYSLNNVSEHFLQDCKDDISVADIFAFQKLDGKHRSHIAKYCVQDCALLLKLLDKLCVCVNNMGMANVCYIPLSYIFLRGQGIKIQSLVNKFCAEKKVLLKTLMQDNDNDDSYEGAVVLKPFAGMYLDDPVAVLDYSSLYPSVMIAGNISQDSKVDSVMTNYNSIEEIPNLDFSNMRQPLIFENLEKYLLKKYDEHTTKQLLIDIPHRFQLYPLYDSVYIPEVNKRYLRFKNIYKIYNKTRDNPRNNSNLNIKNFNYTTIYFDTYKGKGDKKYKTGIKQVTYGTHSDNSKGILPQILQTILAQRKSVRKMQKNETNKFKWNILEGYQLAYKVVANSIYGQTGSSFSVISDLDLASSTTATGRQMLMLAKSFSEEYYQSKVVYGDSITGDEPLILKNPDGIIEIKTIESMCNEYDWVDYENFKPTDTIESNRRFKQKCYTNYQVFTNGKWNPIKKVIRHKTNKKIYRVNTHTGCIDVTEDHSLLDENRNKIKPNDCIIGETNLAHSFPTEFHEFDILVPAQGTTHIINDELYTCNKCFEYLTSELYYYNKTTRQKQCKICILQNMTQHTGKEFDESKIKYNPELYKESYLITKEEAYVWGLFLGNGSCELYKYKSGNKYYWELNNSNLERLILHKNLLENIEPIKFQILDTLQSNGVYKLVPFGSIKYMVNKYRTLFYDVNKYKLVPTNILNASFETRKAFFNGYYDKNQSGLYGEYTQLSFVTNNKISAQCLYYLATSIGYDKLSINIQTNRVKQGTDKYWINTYTTNINQGLLKKKIFLRNSENEFVYDLETEQGTFNAGVGKIELNNTDSVMILFSNLPNQLVVNNLLNTLNTTLDIPIDPNDGSKLSIEVMKLIEVMNNTDGLLKLKLSILRSVVLSNEIATLLRPPHDLEYEKTFYPFILFTKKRYVGMLYETNPANANLKYMGIVLKRRDNPNLVKIIYKGIIDIIMSNCNLQNSIDYLQSCLKKLLNGEYHIDDLTVTKTLKATYKNRESIGHAVLADRIGKRTGEKIPSNTRIPYVFINIPEKKGIKVLQGNRIENPIYIIEHKLKIDYGYYITNQLMKPIVQIYDLVMKTPEKIFEDALRINTNKKNNNIEISNWFKPINKNANLNTTFIIEKGCIFLIQKSKSVKKKCNQDCINNTNYCKTHLHK